MASISKRASYVEFKVERPADVDVGSSDDEDNTIETPNHAIATAKKAKRHWACGLRRSTTASVPPTMSKIEFKVSFTVQGVHSFCLRTGRSLETHDIPQGTETQRCVTLQEPGGQQSEATWRTSIALALSGTVPDQLMSAMVWKLQRDLSALPLPPPNKCMRRLVVIHVHVPVKVVTPDGVTAQELLNRVSTPVSRRRVEGDDQDCVICLEGLEVDRGASGLEVRRMLVCSHVFHGECLLRWLLKRASCPVCWSRCLGLFLPETAIPYRIFPASSVHLTCLSFRVFEIPCLALSWRKALTFSLSLSLSLSSQIPIGKALSLIKTMKSPITESASSY